MTRHRTTQWPVVVGGSMSFAVASAGVLTAAIVHFSPPESASPAPEAPQAASSAPVTQDGTVIAVTADSVTTRGDDGLIQTYRLTPDTYAVTADRRQPASPAASFAVDDRVSIFATVEAGQPVATAVADVAAVGPDGPPMDYLNLS